MAGEAAAASFDLLSVVALLGAGVIAVPIFKRLGLGSVLGYLAGGLADRAVRCSGSSAIPRPSSMPPSSAS